MRTLKLSSVLVIHLILTCSGYVVEDPPPAHPPPSHLKTQSLPLQRISDTGKDAPKHLPVSYVKEYSEVHDRTQSEGVGSLPATADDGQDNPIPGGATGRSRNDIGDERKGSSSSSKPKFEGHSQRPLWAALNIGGLVEDDLLTLNLLNKYRKSFQSQVSKDESRDQTNDITFWSLILSAMSPYYLPSLDPSIVNNSQCLDDVTIIHNPKGDGQNDNATAMFDSWGKLPDGLFGGNFHVMGSFDECLSVRMPRNPSGAENPQGNPQGTFKGKYCTVYYQNFESEQTKNETEYTEVKMPSILAVPEYPAMFLYEYGTCIPSSCTEGDLKDSLDSFLMNKSAVAYCQTDEDPTVEFTPGLISMIVILSLFACLLIVGALIDIWIQFTGKEELRKGPLKYLLVFSFSTNLEKMFKINTSENAEAITCFYGMRTLSMTWVVMGHQYIMNLFWNGNVLYFAQIFDGRWLTQILLNAYPSVDSFFFMSGLLVAYGIFREKDRTGSINLFVFYIHRFLRLCIPILLVCGFMAVFPRYLSHGPFARFSDSPNSLQDVCQNYWWRDALFISNYFPATSIPTTCLGVCWYTAVDFQLFIVTPIMLLPLLWGDKLKLKDGQINNIGFIWLGIVTLVSVLVPGIITGVNQLPPTQVTSAGDAATAEGELIYFATWCRAQPYLVGIWMGILLRRYKKKDIKLQKWQVIGGWLVATATGLAVIFGMYSYNQFDTPREYYWPDSIFYASLHRLAWGMCLGWVVFACHYGYGGAVNSFLSHPSWQPLSRLTYCLFLVAIPVQQIVYVYNDVYPAYFSHLSKVTETVASLFIAGVGAVLLSLCAEGPVLGLEKILLRRDGTAKPTVAPKT